MATTKKSAKTYRELSQELDAIVAELQRDDLDIDEALRGYERGLGIIKQLETYLRTAENKVTKLRAEFNEQP